jgi:hypothetical protein
MQPRDRSMEPNADQPAAAEQPAQEQAAQEQPAQDGPVKERAVSGQGPSASAPPTADKRKTRGKSNWHHRKAQLLPQITQLALEGHSGRSIAQRLNVPVRSVNYLLKDLRRQWLAGAARTSAEMMSVELARLNAIYREAMEAWRRSEAEAQAWLAERRKGGEDGAASNEKPPRRNAALLRGALAAVRQVRDFLDRAAPRAAAARPSPAQSPRPSGDLESLSEEELLALEAQCGLLSQDRAHPGPVPAGEGNCTASPHPGPLPEGEGSCSASPGPLQDGEGSCSTGPRRDPLPSSSA